MLKTQNRLVKNKSKSTMKILKHQWIEKLAHFYHTCDPSALNQSKAM